MKDFIEAIDEILEHALDLTSDLSHEERALVMNYFGEHLKLHAKFEVGRLFPDTCTDLGGADSNDQPVFHCSECGCVLSLYDADGSNNLCTSFIYDYPRFCPECGRRVV